MSVTRLHHVHAEERDRILQRLSESLATRGDIAFAYTHGSFLRDEGFHDIDVAVWATDRADPRTDLDVAAELARAVAYPVDVRVVNEAPVAFLFHVFRGHPLAVHDERLLADLIERTARTYHDRAPLVRRAAREAFAT
jgi:predicted nucleotidyltransferase